MAYRRWFHKILSADSPIEGLLPIIFFSRIGGFMPFNFDIKYPHSEMKINIPLFFLTFVYGTFYTFCVVKVLLTGEMVISSRNYSILLQVGDYSRIYISFIIMSIIGMTFYYKNKNYVKIFDLFISADLKFKTIGKRLKFTNLKRSFIISICGQNIFNLFNIFIHAYLTSSWKEPPSLYMVFVTYVPGIFFAMLLLTYCALNQVCILNLNSIGEVLITIAEKRLKYSINCSVLPEKFTLKKRVHSIDRSKSQEMCDVKKIHELWMIYDTICDASNKINEMFTFKVLIVFTGSFISIVFNLFHAAMSMAGLRGEEARLNFILLLMALHHSLAYMIVVTIPILVCDKCKCAAKRVAVLVNQIMVHESDIELSTKLHHFSMYMVHRIPNYTISGLCAVDNSLLFTIIGATTTYIVILIQFSTIKFNPNDLNFIVSDNITESN